MAGHRSRAAFARARESIPGGVNSPARAFSPVGGEPPFIASAKGARLTDLDGNTWIDYVCSWGPLVLGHADDEVVAAIAEAAARGTSYGAPTEVETELAEAVRELLPSLDLVRFVNSGTEATMSALRVARGFTGRDLIVKFEGNYHGHADSLLVKAGSGAATLGVPTSPGVPAAVAEHTLTLPYNDAAAVREAFSQHGEAIAAIIVEPVAGNMGLILPVDGFLEGLRAACDEFGALLVFDEVMTGFRVALGGAQARYGVRPDLTTLGKVIGGGLPVGAYGGRRDVMEHVAPLGGVYQAGTLSGNPLAMTAGLVTLRRFAQPGVFEAVEARTTQLVEGLVAAAGRAGVEVTAASVGTMWGLFFHPGPVTGWESASASDTERFAAWHRGMLERGVYLAPSQFEAGFLSIAHGDAEIAATLDAASATFSAL